MLVVFVYGGAAVAKKQPTSYKLRMPAQLRAAAERLAKKSDRSLNAELVALIEAAVEAGDVNYIRGSLKDSAHSVAVATLMLDGLIKRMDIAERGARYGEESLTPEEREILARFKQPPFHDPTKPDEFAETRERLRSRIDESIERSKAAQDIMREIDRLRRARPSRSKMPEEEVALWERLENLVGPIPNWREMITPAPLVATTPEEAYEAMKKGAPPLGRELTAEEKAHLEWLENETRTRLAAIVRIAKERGLPAASDAERVVRIKPRREVEDRAFTKKPTES
jgi:hypothetical protein